MHTTKKQTRWKLCNFYRVFFVSMSRIGSKPCGITASGTETLLAPDKPQKYEFGANSAGYHVNAGFVGTPDCTLNINSCSVNVHFFVFANLGWFRHAPSHGWDVSRLSTASAIANLLVQADGDVIAAISDYLLRLRRYSQIHFPVSPSLQFFTTQSHKAQEALRLYWLASPAAVTINRLAHPPQTFLYNAPWHRQIQTHKTLRVSHKQAVAPLKQNPSLVGKKHR